jgi:segregation and condensation protein B
MPFDGGVDAEDFPVSRDYEPQAGQWYEDLDNEESFQVLSVDPDEEIIRIQWPDREIREIDLDQWNEMDLELALPPEGWVDDVEDDDDEDDEDDDWEEDEDDDDDWDDDDEDDDLDEDDDEYRDRE